MNLAGVDVGSGQDFFLLAGPCVIESESLVMQIAQEMKQITLDLNIHYVFKASFDKANRSSHESFRGLGMAKGLEILAKVKRELALPVMTDVHEDTPLDEVADVVDLLQTPAFLCRQTNFIQRVCAMGLPVNIKKGQFLAPEDMMSVVAKAKHTGNHSVMVCERGASFGYRNLVSDMRSLAIMRQTDCPVVFDATHSVQLPGGLGHASGGQRQFVPVLARAAVGVGIDGLFMETHPNPEEALSDGPNAWPLDQMRVLLKQLQAIDQVVKSSALAENFYC